MHNVAPRGQQEGHHLGCVLVVVHQQDASSGGRVRPRCGGRLAQRRSSLRQIDDEATASTEALALGDDRATVQTDQSAHEGEAQTEPRRCQGAGRALGLRETFEDALELISLDAGALVGHFEPHLGVAPRCRYADEAAFARELGRICEQVRQHARSRLPHRLSSVFATFPPASPASVTSSRPGCTKTASLS